MTKMLNPLIVKLAGRRHFRMAAQIRHVGRRSGRTYTTPVSARRTGDMVAIALTFGNQSDWSRNIRSAGGGAIRTRARTTTSPSPSSSAARRPSRSYRPRSAPWNEPASPYSASSRSRFCGWCQPSTRRARPPPRTPRTPDGSVAATYPSALRMRSTRETAPRSDIDILLLRMRSKPGQSRQEHAAHPRQTTQYHLLCRSTRSSRRDPARSGGWGGRTAQLEGFAARPDPQDKTRMPPEEGQETNSTSTYATISSCLSSRPISGVKLAEAICSPIR